MLRTRQKSVDSFVAAILSVSAEVRGLCFAATPNQ